MKKGDGKIRIAIAVALFVILVFSGNKIMEAQAVYSGEKDVHEQVLVYKPKPQGAAGSVGQTDAIVLNQSIIDMQAQNGDAVGWLTVPGTGMDYPFMQTPDNRYYLDRDFNKEYSAAGTLFLDHRCNSGFSGFNTIIYGHHMKNGTMFGSMKLFQDEIFFKENKTAYIYLPDKTYEVELFAYALAGADDKEIYSTEYSDGYFGYVKEKARYWRETGAAKGDRIVTLSTCAYEFEGARMVLAGKIVV